MYEQNVIAVQQAWFILCCGYKWLGDDAVTVMALPDYSGYKKDKTNDKQLMLGIREVLNEADIVIAHNCDAFDAKKINARLLIHDIPPPSTYKTIDTLKISKKYFKLNKNSLNSLGQELKLGEKMPTGGFDLWLKCMAGDEQAWEVMKTYNAQDVSLLEKVYLRIRPWATNHPNLGLYGDIKACPACASTNVQRRGYAYAKTQRYQRLHCQECGHWHQGPLVKKSEVNG